MLALNEARGRRRGGRCTTRICSTPSTSGCPGFLLFAWLHLLVLPQRAGRREARARGSGARASWRRSRRACRSRSVAFFVAAMFHPIAYQFYFFCIAGLAVALKNTVPRARLRATRVVCTGSSTS